MNRTHIPIYINNVTCVELTETTLSTATTWPWLYTNRRCCTVARSGVGGLGGARAIGNGNECNMVIDWLKKPEPEVNATWSLIWG